MRRCRSAAIPARGTADPDRPLRPGRLRSERRTCLHLFTRQIGIEGLQRIFVVLRTGQKRIVCVAAASGNRFANGTLVVIVYLKEQTTSLIMENDRPAIWAFKPSGRLPIYNDHFSREPSRLRVRNVRGEARD